MNWLDPWLLLVPIGGLVLLFAVWRFFGIGRAIQVERARELFRLQHERLENMLREAAEKTGKPRGVRWLRCTIAEEPLLTRQPRSRKIVGFVAVVVQFEPIPGGDMEDIAAVHEERRATAIFYFERGAWSTEGRVIFNHSPEQALQQLPDHELIEHHHHPSRSSAVGEPSSPNH